MPKIFLAPYHSNLHDETTIKARASSGDLLRGYVSAIHLPNAWPYDNGDDPSFFSSRYLDGPITWGVCRGDLRNTIIERSVVVFFAFTSVNNTTEYRLSGLATVVRKVQQSWIYQNDDLKLFKQYLNLLIAPCDSLDSRWRHDEPCYPSGGHDDWLWRLADRSLFKSKDFPQGQEASEIKIGQRVNGKPYALGRNYVIFSTDDMETFIIEKPPAVADSFDGNVEIWRPDDFSQGILSRTLTLARQHGKSDRGLRATGTRQPHCPAARWQMDDEALRSWRADLVAFLQQYGCHRQTPFSTIQATEK